MTLDRQQLEFAELLRLNQPRLLGFIRSLVLDANDAQDVFQETVLALWENHRAFEASRDFGAWAVGIARNKVFDYYKSAKRRKQRLGDDVLQQLAQRGDAAENAEYLQARQEALARCMQTLPARHQELLRRCYDGAQSVGDVAASLQRTTGSIYSSLRHLRLRLMQCIERRMNQEVRHV